MILNQAHPSSRDLQSGARLFLNKSKTSFDIASLVSSGSESLQTAMSPRNSISPDLGGSKSKRSSCSERWPHSDDIPKDEKASPHQEYHGHKKYRHRHRFDPLRSHSPESKSSPMYQSFESAHGAKTDKRTPTPTSPIIQPRSNEFKSASPNSAFQPNIPQNQLLKAVAAGVLQFPFPYFGGVPASTSASSLPHHLPPNLDSENAATSPKALQSPKRSPLNISTPNAADASIKSSDSLNPALSASPNPPPDSHADTASSSFTFPSLHSPLLSPTANSDMDSFSRQAFLQAAAGNSTFPTTGHLPGLSGSFMSPCFPRIPSSPIGTSAFDPTSSMALRSAFCPPNTPPASYNPWLLRQAAASVRPFPPHLAGTKQIIQTLE